MIVMKIVQFNQAGLLVKGKEKLLPSKEKLCAPVFALEISLVGKDALTLAEARKLFGMESDDDWCTIEFNDGTVRIQALTGYFVNYSKHLRPYKNSTLHFFHLETISLNKVEENLLKHMSQRRNYQQVTSDSIRGLEKVKQEFNL